MLKLLRTNPDLRALFIAQVISFMGDWFTFVAITGIIKEVTGSAFLVSLAYVSFTLPSFLASPIAGPVVDKFEQVATGKRLWTKMRQKGCLLKLLPPVVS